MVFFFHFNCLFKAEVLSSFSNKTLGGNDKQADQKGAALVGGGRGAKVLRLYSPKVLSLHAIGRPKKQKTKKPAFFSIKFYH